MVLSNASTNLIIFNLFRLQYLYETNVTPSQHCAPFRSETDQHFRFQKAITDVKLNIHWCHSNKITSVTSCCHGDSCHGDITTTNNYYSYREIKIRRSLLQLCNRDGCQGDMSTVAVANNIAITVTIEMVVIVTAHQAHCKYSYHS